MTERGCQSHLAGCSQAAPQFWAGLTSIWTVGMYHLRTAQRCKAHDIAGEQLLIRAGSNPPAWAGRLSTYEPSQCDAASTTVLHLALPALPHVFFAPLNSFPITQATKG